MKIVPKKELGAVLEYLDDVSHSTDISDATSKAHGMIATYEDTHPKLAKYLMDNLGNVMTFLAFPKTHHSKIHSTNVLERFNKEVNIVPKLSVLSPVTVQCYAC